MLGEARRRRFNLEQSMADARTIEVGKTYWVELDGRRFKARAVKPTTLPNWWLCHSELLNEQVVVPERAFRPTPFCLRLAGHTAYVSNPSGGGLSHGGRISLLRQRGAEPSGRSSGAGIAAHR